MKIRIFMNLFFANQSNHCKWLLSSHLIVQMSFLIITMSSINPYQISTVKWFGAQLLNIWLLIRQKKSQLQLFIVISQPRCVYKDLKGLTVIELLILSTGTWCVHLILSGFCFVLSCLSANRHFFAYRLRCNMCIFRDLLHLIHRLKTCPLLV